VVLQPSGLGGELTTPHRKRKGCYETLHRTSGLLGSCEHGNEPSDSEKGRENSSGRGLLGCDAV
jgi:hypothetical protein